MSKIPYRIYLSEDQIPKQWYNVKADMKAQHEPLLNPGTGKPLEEKELYPIFCEKLAHQEMDTADRYIDIPEEIQNYYKIYRPNSIRPWPRPITPRSRVLRALRPKRERGSGARLCPWPAPTSAWT